ncbi:MAG TPA: DUF971 domain-containing protein [Limnobacter sp.]|nr:DUF971 domain-containing protein [Limnobacter sp.]
METSNNPIPTRIVVHQQSKVLEVEFDTGAMFKLPFELLRVYSPSAEVRGHGPGQETLQVGKRDVSIVNLEPVGMYAVKPTFSDGHDSGLFSWAYLLWLGENHSGLWDDYLERLKAAGGSRDPDAPENIPLQQKKGGACASH